MKSLSFLSEAKDHLAVIERRKKILRFAQNDTPWRVPSLYKAHWNLRIPVLPLHPTLQLTPGGLE